MNLIFPRLIATLSNIFRINKVTLDTSNVTLDQVIMVPNKSGTIALLDDVNLQSPTNKHVEIVLFEGFNEDIVYTTGGNKSPDYVMTNEGDLFYMEEYN